MICGQFVERVDLLSSKNCSLTRTVSEKHSRQHSCVAPTLSLQLSLLGLLTGPLQCVGCSTRSSPRGPLQAPPCLTALSHLLCRPLRAKGHFYYRTIRLYCVMILSLSTHSNKRQSLSWKVFCRRCPYPDHRVSFLCSLQTLSVM